MASASWTIHFGDGIHSQYWAGGNCPVLMDATISTPDQLRPNFVKGYVAIDGSAPDACYAYIYNMPEIDRSTLSCNSDKIPAPGTAITGKCQWFSSGPEMHNPFDGDCDYSFTATRQ